MDVILNFDLFDLSILPPLSFNFRFNTLNNRLFISNISYDEYLKLLEILPPPTKTFIRTNDNCFEVVLQ